MNEKLSNSRDYSRFHVTQARSRFSLLDQETGWVWDQIQCYISVLEMMNHILDNELEFKADEYKRIRRLEGDEWEQELKVESNQEVDKV